MGMSIYELTGRRTRRRARAPPARCHARIARRRREPNGRAGRRPRRHLALHLPTSQSARMLTAVFPEIAARSLLDADSPTDPAARLELVLERFTRHMLEHEPALRAQHACRWSHARRAGSAAVSQGTRDRLDRGRSGATPWAPARPRAATPRARYPRHNRDQKRARGSPTSAGLSREEATELMRSLSPRAT